MNGLTRHGRPARRGALFGSSAQNVQTHLLRIHPAPHVSHLCLAEAPRPEWKVDLARLKTAVRESAEPGSSEIRLEEPDSQFLEKERVYLVGVQVKSASADKSRFSVEESLQELERLATSAGLLVVGKTMQRLDAPNPASYIGSGKVAEVVTACGALAIDTVIFDDELSPGQQRNLEKVLGRGVRVADRTALILDIFDQRARSREGRLQVELAATTYQLPRLKRMWTHLERQMGSGAMRAGMGEKQKEIDKRLLRDKMTALRKEIELVRKHRKAYRRRRKAASMPVVALVGYTNAGKSTLINALTAADVHAADVLFATLDPTTRKSVMPSGTEVLISDTVGFVQKLPTQLIAAFRATLEEIEEADVLLHVVDVSHPEASKQSAAVFQVLKEISVSDSIPMVTVWNKLDACADPAAVAEAAAALLDTVAVSAAAGTNLEELRLEIERAMERSMVAFEALVPYSDGAVLSELRAHGVLRSEEFGNDGVQVVAAAGPALLGRVRQYVHRYLPEGQARAWQDKGLEGGRCPDRDGLVAVVGASEGSSDNGVSHVDTGGHGQHVSGEKGGAARDPRLGPEECGSAFGLLHREVLSEPPEKDTTLPSRVHQK